MSGVALVGYSGSLIHDTIKVVAPPLVRALGYDAPIQSAEEPEVSRVIIGEFFPPMSKSNFKYDVPSRHFLHSVCTSLVSLHCFL